jgi:ABC-type multidrug transport system permease subunit
MQYNLSLQVVIELPHVFVQAVSYGVIVYAMIGFEWTAAKFFWYLFFMCFSLLYFTFYGMIAVGVTPNHHIASVITYAFYTIWNLFSGFIIPRPVSFSTSNSFNCNINRFLLSI